MSADKIVLVLDAGLPQFEMLEFERRGALFMSSRSIARLEDIPVTARRFWMPTTAEPLAQTLVKEFAATNRLPKPTTSNGLHSIRHFLKDLPPYRPAVKQTTRGNGADAFTSTLATAKDSGQVEIERLEGVVEKLLTQKTELEYTLRRFQSEKLKPSEALQRLEAEVKSLRGVNTKLNEDLLSIRVDLKKAIAEALSYYRRLHELGSNVTKKKPLK